MLELLNALSPFLTLVVGVILVFVWNKIDDLRGHFDTKIGQVYEAIGSERDKRHERDLQAAQDMVTRDELPRIIESSTHGAVRAILESKARTHANH